MSEKDEPADDALLSGSYALDALSPEERASFEAALAASETLRSEAAELADTAALLGSGVPPATPPASLKAELLAKIASVPQLPAPSEDVDAADADLAPADAAEPSSDASPARAAGPAARRARRRWFARPGFVTGAVAASVVLIAAVVIGVGWPGPNGWGAQRELATISAASDSRQQTIDVAGGGQMTLVWSDRLGSSAVMVEGMSPLEPETTYELWYIDEGGARSAGTFDIDSSGSTWRILEGTMAPGDTVGMTVEPAGGSEQPTTDPIAVLKT
jgi:anti-sigma-K factor RskA